MNQRSILTLLFGACAVLLLVGFVFSSRIEAAISHAAHVEATQQSPVPTPPGLQPAKVKAS
jgi:hypothetical protein